MASQLLKLDEPKNDPTNPWADDDFDRREHGERLARLVRTMPGPFVLALKAPWGAGKTVFLERWAHHLENDPNYPVPVVRLDLWENDYLDDPMDAFVVSLSDRLLKASAKEKNKTKLKALASAVAETGPKLVPFVARVVAAVSTGGTTELVITAADLFKEAGANLLGKSKEHKTSVLDFREQLKKAREALAKAQTDSTVPRSPLVFLVDELDRCRPDFSIRALERIKHFFNVPGIVFVIATDGDNLPSAVQCLYGPSVEGERYLRKFFDFEFRLPDPTSEQVALSFFRKFGLLASFESSGGHVNFDENRKRWRENKEPSSHHSGDAFCSVTASK